MWSIGNKILRLLFVDPPDLGSYLFVGGVSNLLLLNSSIAEITQSHQVPLPVPMSPPLTALDLLRRSI